jgi:hypothetical protein
MIPSSQRGIRISAAMERGDYNANPPNFAAMLAKLRID